MLYALILAHVIVVVSANYLTQFPFHIAGFATTYGAFTFPLVYLITDLTIRTIGQGTARKVILLVSVPVVFLSWAVASLFFNGEFQGWGSLLDMNWLVLRISVASFMAYAFGQLLDISVFSYLRKRYVWWVAPACSMTLGNLIDTVLFFGIAFYANSSNPYLAEHWFDIAMFDTVFKVTISLLFLLPAYGIILNRLVSTRKVAA